jgi:hypothetical protein
MVNCCENGNETSIPVRGRDLLSNLATMGFSGKAVLDGNVRATYCFEW